MKQLFYIIAFLLSISCQNSNQIKEIEVLTYFTNARNFEIYSSTDKTGFTQILFKKFESDHLDNCQTKIDKSTIDSIEKLCNGKTAKDFMFKRSKKLWYCGNYKSVRITFENGEKLIFKYPFANDENKQFLPFQSLCNQVKHDSVSATRLNLGQLGQLCIKQEDLSNYNFKEDSIYMQNFLKKH